MKTLCTKFWGLIAIIATIVMLSACEVTIEGNTPIDPEQQQPSDEPGDTTDPSDDENDEEKDEDDNGNDELETPEEPETSEEPETPEEPDTPETPVDPTPENPENPAVDNTIEAWTGLWADDRGMDVVGSNNDYFHELCSFPNKVVVRFEGNSAKVESSNSSVASHISGAYVGLDLTSVSGVEVVV